MNIRNLILGGAVALSLGFMAVGCNENPDDLGTTPIPGTLNGVTNLQVTSMSATSVGLTWTPSSDTGTVTYMVSWKTTGGTMDSSSNSNITSPAAVVGGLQAGREYTFTVTSFRGTDRSSTANSPSINWAGAARSSGSTTLRMYEASSTSPSGLSLSASGGPVNVSLKATEPGFAQLAMTVSPTNDTVVVGPLYALVEYEVSDNFNPSKVDSSTYISAATYVVPSLDAWYMNMSLDKMIELGSNVKAYAIAPASQGNAQGFVVRFGQAGNYRYARVLLKAGSNGILQGTRPNRYVETEISLQSTPNLPYAKGSVGQLPPIGVYAKRLK